jgi:hypothetical protein
VIPENLPDYVDHGGRQVWRPPYSARSAELFGFVLEADRDDIDDLLHRDLVEPAGGAVDYRCAHASIVVAFAAIERLSSGDARDRLRGFISELEVSVWCLVADVLAGDRLLWYMPYVFVDSGQASASGREVFGYPKQVGVFAPGFLEPLADGGTTTVEALAIDPFGEDQPAALLPMVSARRAAGGQPVIDTGDTAFAFIVDHLAEGLGVSDELPIGPGPRTSAAITPIDEPPPSARPPATPAWAARRVLDSLAGRGLTGAPGDLIASLVVNPTLVFLKQFRDVACPTKACYQAVVEAPLAVRPVGAGYEALDPQLFTITVEDWDSHPIASELGVQPRTQVPELAFHATFDFDIQLGLEVWRAPT